jgi:hypothetical protein
MTVVIQDLNHKWACLPAVDAFKPIHTVQNIYFDQFGWSNDWRIGYIPDTLLRDISVVIKLPVCNFFHFVGVKHEGRPTLLYKGDLVHDQDRYDGYQDLKIFGSALGAFLQLWKKPKPMEDIARRERRLSHANYKGDIEDQGNSIDLYLPRRTIGRHGLSYRALPWSEIRPHGVVTLVGSEYLISSRPPDGEPWYHYERVFLDEFADDFPRDPAGFGIQTADGYARNSLRYQDAGMVIQHSLIGNYNDPTYILRAEASLRYRFTNHSTSIIGFGDSIPRATHVYDVHHHILCDLEVSPRRDVPLIGLNESWGNTTVQEFSWNISYDLVDYTTTHVIPNGYPWPSFNGEIIDPPAEVSAPHVVRAPGSVEKKFSNHLSLLTRDNIDYGNYLDLLRYFNAEVSDVHGKMLPAAAISANDCLSSFSSELNPFESVPQLKDAFAGMQNIAEFFGGIKSLSRGDPSGATKIVDALAGGWLFYTYGAKPNVSDAEEAHRVAVDMYGKLGELGNQLPGHLYGKFSFRPPWKLKGVPGELTVVVRSKMVLNRSQAVVLAWAMALDEVGLLPNLTRGYDLIKFSFVFDWFTNLGDRLSDVDKMSLRFAVDVSHYVHSFYYVYTPTPDFLARYSCRSSRFQLTKIERYLSRYNPMLKESEYDFHPPRGVKNRLLTAGSLIWVLK